MKRSSPKGRAAPAGPSQRQLRAGELMRHALVEILREEDFNDEALTGVSVTVTEPSAISGQNRAWNNTATMRRGASATACSRR